MDDVQLANFFIHHWFVLYDGAPTTAIWDLVDEFGITIFGTSAKWIAIQEQTFKKQLQMNIKNKSSNEAVWKNWDKNGSKLKMILSTGSPLKPQSFDFIYNHIKKDVLLASVSG